MVLAEHEWVQMLKGSTVLDTTMPSYVSCTMADMTTADVND